MAFKMIIDLGVKKEFPTCFFHKERMCSPSALQRLLDILFFVKEW